MNDEFKKALIVWPAAVFLLLASRSAMGNVSDEALNLWLKVAGGVLLFLFLGTMFGVPVAQDFRRRRAIEQLVALVRQARYLETIELAEKARRLWPNWEGPTYTAALAELLLWRIDAARRSSARLMNHAHEPESERKVFSLALTIDEVAGDAERTRERVERARLPEAFLTLPNLIRAARERDDALVLQLSRADSKAIPAFDPLVAALVAWAQEKDGPRPINKIALLGETGLEQLEKVWPDLADFIKRSPSVGAS